MNVFEHLTTSNALTVFMGLALLGTACGAVGTFAVLRRQSLLSDALAHAALPGVCVAYLISADRTFSTLFVGAVVAGLLSVWMISAIHRHSRIKEDAAIGIVLSTTFGAGIALSRIIQNNASGNQAGLDDFIFGKAANLMRDDIILITVAATVTVAVIVLLLKELALVCFDREFARTQGLPVGALDALLMALICLCTAAGLPAVGAILVSALLIFPASTARLWTDRIVPMLLLSALCGATAAAVGVVVSIAVPLPPEVATTGIPTGPLVVLCCAALFALSLVMAPLVRKWRAP